MKSQEGLYDHAFSHIYVEEAAADHVKTREILKKFPDSAVIPIHHYKDFFNRKHQNCVLQHKSQALILAVQSGDNVYPGAKVCQDFGNEHFFYTSDVYNCIFNCDYCYLKGMYPSGNLVIFVNIEDTFAQVEELLKKHSVYLCVSYDTDLVALESITGYVSLWNSFTLAHPGLKTEIRTKSAAKDIYDHMQVCDRVIFAYTISPEYVAENFEHGAGSMKGRIAAAAYAMEKGYSVRLCFDPMIRCPDWKKEYGRMLDAVICGLDITRVSDVSVGSFRISQEYMKQMRKNNPGSPVVQFPYENISGVYQYPLCLRKEMEDFVTGRLTEHIPAERIFGWED